MKIKILLIFILLLSAFLRLYNINQVPPGLTWDEVSIGYDGYSILKTGKDQWGQTFPLAFKSFGEYKYPLHIYAAALSINFFGLNEFGIRLPSALLGIVNVFLLFLVTSKLTKIKFVALAAALLLAISPWHIQFSRISWETNFSLLFFLAGIYLFLHGIDRQSIHLKKNRASTFIVSSFLLFGIGLFTYNAAKIFIVLFISLLLLIYRYELLRKKLILVPGLVIFVIFLSFNLFDPRLSGINRFQQLDFEQAEVSSTQTYKTTKIYSLGKIELTARQYLLYFSPKFLFISGDPNLRHSTQTIGQVYFLEAFLIPFGIFYLFKKNRIAAFLLICWLLLAPIPGSFTKEAPHASRAMFFLGSWQILAATGLYYLYLSLKNYGKVFLGIFFVSLIYFLINYFNYYLYEYPIKSSEQWKYGYKQVLEYIKVNYDRYDLIVLTRAYGEPQIFTLFYLQYDPARYHSDPQLKREKIGDWVEVERFDKFYFPDLAEKGTTFVDISIQNPGKKILFIGKSGDFPMDKPILSQINFLNGNPAFQIADVK